MIANRDTRKGYIVTVNGGSSSIKFGLFALSPRLRPILSGKVERIGLPGTKLTATSVMTRQSHSVFLNASAPAGCVKPLLDFLEEKVGLNRVAAIAHRIVHGGVRYRQPHWISSELVDALRDLCPFHLVGDVVDRLPQLGSRAAYAKQAIREKLLDHKHYVRQYGDDMPEVRDWKWAVPA